MSMTARPVLPETHLTQAMMDRIARLRPASTAEALRELRAAFPEIPLAARVTALEAVHRLIAVASAADLKFLLRWQQIRPGTSNRKAALES